MKNFKSITAGFLISISFSVSAMAQTASLSQFHYEESNTIYAHQSYNAAPSGSALEGMYRQVRDLLSACKKALSR